MGSKRLFNFVDDNPLVQLCSTEFVNDPSMIKMNPKVVAINCAIEVDLTGQVIFLFFFSSSFFSSFFSFFFSFFFFLFTDHLPLFKKKIFFLRFVQTQLVLAFIQELEVKLISKEVQH